MRKIVRNKNVHYTYARESNDMNDFFLFIYNPETGKDYVFNRLSALMWEMLDHITSDEEITKKIIIIFDLQESNKLVDEINKTFNLLLKHKLIVEVS